MHPIYDKRAVSHIVATLMLVTVTVAASLVTYLFMMNYVQLSTAKSGKAIEIQTMNIANGRLTVYLQNVGQETANFDPANCIYTNGILKNSTINKTPHSKTEKPQQ